MTGIHYNNKRIKDENNVNRRESSLGLLAVLAGVGAILGAAIFGRELGYATGAVTGSVVGGIMYLPLGYANRKSSREEKLRENVTIPQGKPWYMN